MKLNRRSLSFLSVWLLVTFLGAVGSASASGTNPYFKFSVAKSAHRPDGIFTLIHTEVHFPNACQSIRIQGPGGFDESLTDSDFNPALKAYVKSFPVQPVAGEYTFTALDTSGSSAKNYYELTKVDILPIPDSSSFVALGNQLSPLLSWSDFPDYQGNSLFQVSIFDSAGNSVWMSGILGNTSVKVPSGILSSDESYKWTVSAFDGLRNEVTDNRSQSEPVPLVVASEQPGFLYAGVRSRNTGGGDSTVVYCSLNLGNPFTSGGSYSISVAGPQEQGFSYSFQDSDYDPSSNEFVHRFTGLPEPGFYTFTASAPSGPAITTTHYLGESFTVPQVDSATLQATGDPLAPTFFWCAPPGMTRSYYYQVDVLDKNTGNRVWRYSTSSTGAAKMPQGILNSNGSYQWRVNVIDLPWQYLANNDSRTQKMDLVVDNSTPNFFYGASVYISNQPDGKFTILDTYVNDPDGAGLAPSMSLVATGPSGFSPYTFSSTDLLPYPPSQPVFEYWHTISGTPIDGLYTFTLKYSPAKSIVTRDWLKAGPDIPFPDESTFQVFGADTLTPTVSWAGISGYDKHLYYRLKITDYSGLTIYNSAREPVTTQTIPSGTLQSGQSYLYRVEAQEDPNWIIYNNRSQSPKFILADGGPTVVTPTFNPAGGTYATAQTVKIACATAGATIRYTTDGSDPTSTSPSYSGPITVSGSTTLKARAFRANCNDSGLASTTYTITTPPVATPTFSPAGGTYSSAQKVKISCATSGAKIRYTTNGSDPTSTSAAYTSPINISSTTNLKACAFKSGMSNSAVASATYTITIPPVATPTFSPAGGTYSKAQKVKISCATSGAKIRYTTDGNDPTSTSAAYTAPVNISSTTTLKACAFKSGMPNSAVSSATYTITIPPVATPTFSPAGGTYSKAQKVKISCATSGAKIRYTTDGSDPTSTSTAYTTQVKISSTTTLKACAFKSGMPNSAVASATYTITTTNTPSDLSGSYSGHFYSIYGDVGTVSMTVTQSGSSLSGRMTITGGDCPVSNLPFSGIISGTKVNMTASQHCQGLLMTIYATTDISNSGRTLSGNYRITGGGQDQDYGAITFDKN